MNKPMDHDPGRDPVADALRATLAAHARNAPRGERLADQIIHSVARPAPNRRGWRTWSLPVIAAAAVAGVVAAVVGIQSYRPEAAPRPPGGSPSTTAVVVAPTGRTTALRAAPTTAAGRLAPTSLHGVRIVDLTFAGVNDGWALASADCLGASGRCTALLRTTDGRTWSSRAGAAFNVPGVRGCADPCVTSIRFATDSVGYAFGAHSLFITTDGGRSWQRRAGGALFLETLDNNVIRITSSGSGCPGPCDVRAETAAIGGATWTPARFPPGNEPASYGLGFARGGSDAYLLILGHSAGGAPDGRSTLYRSTDDGHNWVAAGEPCPQPGQEVDSSAIAAAPHGRVSVLCTTRQAPNRQFVATSTDHGATFAPGGTLPQPVEQVTGDPSTVLLAAGPSLLRSTDGGRSWTRLIQPTGPVSFLGFESPTVGRAVTDGGRTIWTTSDGGRAWSALSMP